MDIHGRGALFDREWRLDSSSKGQMSVLFSLQGNQQKCFKACRVGSRTLSVLAVLLESARFVSHL